MSYGICHERNILERKTLTKYRKCASCDNEATIDLKLYCPEHSRHEFGGAFMAVCDLHIESGSQYLLNYYGEYCDDMLYCHERLAGKSNEIVGKPSQATIETKITATDIGGAGINEVKYGWNTSSTIQPSTWEKCVNGETISKIISEQGTWYLWTNITDNAGNIKITVSKPYQVKENPKAKPGEIVTGGNKEYTDETGTAIIPEGFAVVTDPDTIQNGLVISDKPNDNMNNAAKGNQFVWVPVDNFNEFKRQDFGNENYPESEFVSEHLEDGKFYEPTPNSKDLVATTPQTIDEVTKMYNSVKKNKGFYIGRYEAGRGDNGALVSKKGEYPMNGLKRGNSVTDEQGGAIEEARNMYPGKSTLVYGVQWDAIMRWISKDSTLKRYLKDSTGKGYYTDEAFTGGIDTGSNEEYQMKNIYDMAGNLDEMTMELWYNWDEIYGVTRGGHSALTGSYAPITDR